MHMSSSISAAATATLFLPPQLTRAEALEAYDSGYMLFNGDGGSQLKHWSSLIGIVTAIVGNILISFALNIQRYAHKRLEKESQERYEKSKGSPKSSPNGYGTTAINGNGRPHMPPEEATQDPNGEEVDPLTRSFNSSDTQVTIRPDDDHPQRSTYLTSPYWWLGISLMTVGETGNFLAYGFAPASIVSPLGVVALISNCLIAPIMLKERFRWRDFWGIVVAVGGAVTVGFSAEQTEERLGPHEVIGAITTTEFEIYMGITFVLIGILAWASPKYGDRTILIDLGLVGLFGGYTALSTKGVASMLSSTLWKAFTSPITYALIAVLLVTAVMQVKYVNKALQRFDSTQVIPVQFVLFTLSVIIGSAILYRDFEKADTTRAVKFVGGCLLTFFGVFLITSGRTSQHAEDEFDDAGEESEERIGLIGRDANGEEGFYQDESRRYSSTQRIRNIINEGGEDIEDSDDSSRDLSRRSSRVSFAPTPSRPELVTTQSQTTQTPSVQLTTPAGASHHSVIDEPSPLNNPWKSTVDDLLASQRHPGMPSIASSSAIPSEARTKSPLADSLHPSLTRALSQEDPHTHLNDQNPNGPPQSDFPRPLTPAARHTISRMMPSPLISPLTSSLAAVVADSLRRNGESPLRRQSLRRPHLSLRRYRSSSERHGSGSATEEGYQTSPSKDGHGTSQSLGSKTGEELLKRSRARSLSNAFGNFLMGKREMRDDEERDEEAGPSGQTQ